MQKSNLKLLLTKILKIVAIITYQTICLLIPVKLNRVVFVTPRHDVLKDNLYYLYEEMRKTKPELEYIVLTQRIYNGKIAPLNFIRHMSKVYYYLATSRLFIIDDYYLPLYLIKVRKKTEVIQLWHASGPLKKVGLSLIGLPGGPSKEYLRTVPVHSNYDKVIVNADIEIDIYAQAFGMPKEHIEVLGSPRTDVLFRNVQDTTKKDNFIKEHPEFINKELILYAPTYRGKSNDSNHYIPRFDMEKLVTLLLDKNKVLLVNLHPYMIENEDLIASTDKKAVFWNRKEYTIEDLLMISDALISDYSSVIYDFAILEKPIALYCFDYEEYDILRGFYIDFKELLPTSFFLEEEDLVNWIVSAEKNINEVIEMKVKNFKYHDGQSSRRIIHSLFN
ncbi:CDP-glycerol glycerophosphotransferase family protein [Paenisporosarcina antarctica]|uniref:Ribitolphosphotransferase n=1 Tax=Paenisporosarcina antarctica TaxID=417367 RepID=A0A4P7A010_9BACL|nr:CDP-glycerol glycerophosphotransferase family protein [Paenisporosarcina antarctica]QBP41943.1 hypothetical protein E2636_12620 [Paenisporosarcina antarctica]